MGLSRLFSKFATDRELAQVSGKLQEEINQGGGGSGTPIDETYLVHKTGAESIGGIKNFIDGISGSNFDTVSGYLLSDISGYTEEGDIILGTPKTSVDWKGRVLWGRDETPSIDWDFYVLYANGNVAVDWQLKELYNNSNEVVMNWEDRYLNATDGISLDFGLRQLHAYNGNVTVNWDNKALYGTYVEDFVNVIPVETLAWASRQLLIGEANGFASLNWEGGVLMSTGTNSSGAASNHVVANWFEGILYAMRDSNQPEDGEEAPFVSHASVDWQNRKLYSFTNLGGEEFPDWQDKLTLDWSGRLLHDVWGFVGGGFAAYGPQDEETGELPVFGYMFLNDEGMYFETNDNKTLANITLRRLYGLNNEGFIETSINWGNRTAFDISGNQTVNWNNKTLSTTFYDVIEDFDVASVSVDWNNRVLRSSGAGSGPLALNWQNREAFDNDGVTSIAWNSNRELLTANGATVRWGAQELWDVSLGFPLPVLSWQTRTLVGDWIINPVLPSGSAPSNTSTPVGWATVKLQGGGSTEYKVPFYL